MTTMVPAELPISEARAILTDIATAAKEHHATTTLTKHGKPIAKVVHPDADDGELARLQATVERVEALRDHWRWTHAIDAANELSAALDTPASTTRTETP